MLNNVACKRDYVTLVTWLVMKTKKTKGKTMKSMKVGSIYARTSVEDKDSNKVSIEQQIADCKAKAESMGYKITDNHIYVDRDLSSKLPPSNFQKRGKKTRPALGQMLDAIQQREIQAVFVRKVDRLSRPILLTHQILSELQQYNVGLIATHENIPSNNDASGRFALNVVIASSDFLLEQISSNIKAAKKYQKDRGLQHNGITLLGYERGQKGKAKINESEKEIVLEMFERYARGESYRAIEKWMQELYPQQKIYPITIKGRLQNISYIGKGYDTEGNIIESKVYPPIIPLDLFNEVQKRIKGNKGTKSINNEIKHLSSGLLKCNECGKHLTLNPQRESDGTKLIYVCNHPHLDDSPRPIRISENEWDNFIYAIVKDAYIPKRIKKSESHINAEILLDKLQSNIDDLNNEFSNGSIDFQTFKQLKQQIEANIIKQKSKVEKFESEGKGEVEKIVDWESLDLLGKRAYAREIISSIHVTDKGAIVTFLNGVQINDVSVSQLSDMGQVFYPAYLRVSPSRKNKLQNAIVPLSSQMVQYGKEYGFNELIWGFDYSDCMDDTDSTNPKFYHLGYAPDGYKFCSKCFRFHPIKEFGGNRYCKPCYRDWIKSIKSKIIVDTMK